MPRPDIRIEFLNIEGLAKRWQCDLHTIEALAETDKLRFYLRPAALEVALAQLPANLYKTVLWKFTTGPIDHRYVYMMFSDKEHKIEITRIGQYDVKAILKAPFCAGFFDLIIPIDEVEDYEFIHSAIHKQNTEFELLSPDFTIIRWCGQEYKFGEMQAKVIKRLWQARENGTPWMYGKHILRDIGSNSYRIRDIFNHNRYWHRFIKSDRTGKYKLNLPSKQLSLFG